VTGAQASGPGSQPHDSTPAVVENVIAELYTQLHRASALPAPPQPHDRLDADLGFDSLTRVELLQRLERALGVALPDSALTSIETVADLVGAIETALKATGTTGAGSARRCISSAPLAPLAPRPIIGVPATASTVNAVLAWHVERHAETTHVILLGEDGPKPFSYGMLAERAQRIAAGLEQLGVGPRASIALMLPTSVEYLQAFFGILLAGAIPVPIYPPARRAQLEEHVHRHAQLLSNAGAEVLITFREARIVARMLRSRVPGLRHIESVSELARRRGSIARAAGAPAADSIALLQYTSGSTGAPKGVVLTHANLLANIRAMGATIAASPSDVFVSWLPLYHDMGLIGAWLGSLYFGCLLILMPPTSFLARPARWLRAVHDYRGTLSASPNFGYEFAARRLSDEDLKGIDLSSLRIAFNGAEAVYPETLERFRRRLEPYGFRPQAMTPVYGLAEAGVGLTFPPLERGPIVDRVDRAALARTGRATPVAEGTPDAIQFVSCGRPLPRYRLRIVADDGAELPERAEGNLQFAGPSATEGYYHNPVATAQLLRGEWRETGDRAYLAKGELYVTGRAKDVIIRRGRHIHPGEIERAVEDIPGIRRGCVVAFGTREDQAGTERLVVVAEVRERGLDTSQRIELQTRINQCVVDCVGEPAEEVILAAPHTVLKTSSGKLRRTATRQAYDDGSLWRAARRPGFQVLRLALESVGLLARRSLDRAARVVYGLFAWSLLAAVAAPVVMLTLGFRSPSRIWRLNHRAARTLLELLGLSPLATWEADLPPTPHLIVVNHSSYADSIFVGALLVHRHRFVAKAELARAPVLGSYLRKLGTLFIERSLAEQSMAEVAHVREALLGGDSVVMFPEGTFTRESGVRAFHLGAFQAAVAARAPIIPLALHGARSVLRDGQRLPRRVPVRAVIGAPLTARADEDAFAAAVRLRDAARAHVLRHCGEPDLESFG